jgi:hypothetical protein
VSALLAEHVARHPEDVGRTVEDFNWVLSVIVRPAGGAHNGVAAVRAKTIKRLELLADTALEHDGQIKISGDIRPFLRKFTNSPCTRNGFA